VALQAIDLGRVELGESFLKGVLERLVVHPKPHEVDDIVSDLKGTDRQELPSWPGADPNQNTVLLPRTKNQVPVDIAGVAGGMLAVLIAEVGDDRKKITRSDCPKWKMAWIDLTSFEMDHMRTISKEGMTSSSVLLAPGCEEDAPVAVLYGSTLIRFDTAGRAEAIDVPVLSQVTKGISITAAALHPDTADLVVAVTENGIASVVQIGADGSITNLARFPGEIVRFAIHPGVIVGMGLRDLVTIDLERGSTALRDLHPYFADQGFHLGMSTVVMDDDSIFVQEGRKVLRVSIDLRVVETEFLLPDSSPRLIRVDDRLLQVRSSGFGHQLNIKSDRIPKS